VACRKQTPAHNLQSHCGTILLPRPGMQASFTRCISLELGCQEFGAPQEHVTCQSGKIRLVFVWLAGLYLRSTFIFRFALSQSRTCPCHPGRPKSGEFALDIKLFLSLQSTTKERLHRDLRPSISHLQSTATIGLCQFLTRHSLSLMKQLSLWPASDSRPMSPALTKQS